MYQPSNHRQAEARRPFNRKHLWRLLLCSVLWAAVSFGCATVNYVTDVIYTADGYGAVVSLDLEYDEGVYAALQEIDPTLTTGVATTQQAAGWAVNESLRGRKLLMRHKFDTLEALQGVPALLAGESGDVSNSFIQSLAITARQINSDTMEYVYAATVVIEASDPDSSSTGGGDELGIGDIFDDYPNLQAAMEEAGPATIIIQTYLPGEISSQSRNGVSDGQVDGGRVRWTFSEDEPGIYELHALSRGSSALAVQRDLADLFGSSEHIQAFENLTGGSSYVWMAAAMGAEQVLRNVRTSLGQEATSKSYTRKEYALLEAAYFAEICQFNDAETKCLMPNVYRAMPLIKKLALRIADDDDNAVSAFASLVTQLVEADLMTLPERVEAE